MYSLAGHRPRPTHKRRRRPAPGRNAHAAQRIGRKRRPYSHARMIQMTTPDATPEVERLWRGTLEKVKVRLVLPAVWRAMEAARPLVIDGDQLVVGFPPSRSHEGGLLVD